MPQFSDGEELLTRLRNSRRIERAGVDWKDIEHTVVTIRERAVDRAIETRKEGWGLVTMCKII